MINPFAVIVDYLLVFTFWIYKYRCPMPRLYLMDQSNNTKVYLDICIVLIEMGGIYPLNWCWFYFHHVQSTPQIFSATWCFIVERFQIVLFACAIQIELLLHYALHFSVIENLSWRRRLPCSTTLKFHKYLSILYNIQIRRLDHVCTTPVFFVHMQPTPLPFQ